MTPHAYDPPPPKRRDPVVIAIAKGLFRLSTLATLALLTSFAVAPDRLPQTPVCPSVRLLGLPCPGCGLTHAFCAFSHGEVQTAIRYNPTVLLAYPAFILLALAPLLRRLAPHAYASTARLAPRLVLPGVLLLYALWAARLSA